MILGHVRIASRSEGRVATGSDALRGVRKHVGRRSGETGETEVRAEERCRYDTCESLQGRYCQHSFYSKIILGLFLTTEPEVRWLVDSAGPGT